MSGPATIEISKAEYELLHNEEEASIVFLGDESEELEIFQDISKNMRHITFYHSHDPSLRPEGVNRRVIYFPGNDGKPAHTDEPYDEELLTLWINVAKFPVVMDIDEPDAIDRLYDRKAIGMVLFMESKDTESDEYKAFYSIAEKFRGHYVFLISHNKAKSGVDFAEYVGVTKFPKVAFVLLFMEDIIKYLWDGDMTEIGLLDFMNKFNSGALDKHYRSQEIPLDYDSEPVHVVVGHTWGAYTMNTDVYTMILVDAPWCTSCPRLKIIWDLLATKYALNKKLIFARIDGSNNDINFDYGSIPSMVFSKKGEVMQYKDKDLEKYIVRFMKNEMGDDWIDVEEESTDL